MKANDIMLGGWVRRRWTCSDTGREIVKNFKITEIRKNGDALYAWGEGVNMGLVEYLKPIPLTAEILEKNGFSKSRLMGEQRHFTYYLAPSVSLLAIYDADFSLKIGDCARYIKYVHELQHVLRLCGIEKEIEL